MTKQYISPLRFHSSNAEQKTARELLLEINELRASLPSNPGFVSMYEIVGSDEGKYAPAADHLKTVHGDGRIIDFKSVVRGTVAKLSGEYPNPIDAEVLAEFYEFMGASIRKSIPKLEETRKRNKEIANNNMAIEDLYVQYNAQHRHEATLDEYRLAAVAAEEKAHSDEDRFQEIESAMSKLAAAAKKAVAKVTAPKASTTTGGDK